MLDTKSKPVLIVIALVLLAILGLLVMEVTKPEPEDEIAESIKQMVDDIGDQVAKERGE